MDIPDTQEELLELYVKFKPVGSGPLGMMRIVRSFIREVATLREYNMELFKVEGCDK